MSPFRGKQNDYIGQKPHYLPANDKRFRRNWFAQANVTASTSGGCMLPRMLTRVSRVTCLILAILLIGRNQNPILAQGAGQRMPVFEVDPAWPRLPNNWVLGIVSSV